MVTATRFARMTAALTLTVLLTACGTPTAAEVPAYAAASSPPAPVSGGQVTYS
jgi:hypothetical protein